MSNHEQERADSGRSTESVDGQTGRQTTANFDVMQLHKEGAAQRASIHGEANLDPANALNLGQVQSATDKSLVSAVYHPGDQNQTNLSSQNSPHLQEVHWHGGNYGYRGYQGYGGNWGGNNIGPIIGGLLLWEATRPRYYNPPPQYYVEPAPQYYVEPAPPPVYYEQDRYYSEPIPIQNQRQRQWDYDDGW